MKAKSIKNTELWNMIYSYGNWDNDEGEERNQEAKKKLYDFYNELLKYSPSNEYKKRGFVHLSYVRNLVIIKKAFDEEKYQRVCHELINLMHYEPFFQSRIYFNLIDLLEKELDIGGS